MSVSRIPNAETLRLSMGELTADEVRVAQAAYRLALAKHAQQADGEAVGVVVEPLVEQEFGHSCAATLDTALPIGTKLYARPAASSTERTGNEGAVNWPIHPATSSTPQPLGVSEGREADNFDIRELRSLVDGFDAGEDALERLIAEVSHLRDDNRRLRASQQGGVPDGNRVEAIKHFLDESSGEHCLLITSWWPVNGRLLRHNDFLVVGSQMRAERLVRTLTVAASTARANEWQPIETAPNNESILVAYDDGSVKGIDKDDNDYQWRPYVLNRKHKAMGVATPKFWRKMPDHPEPSL